MSWEVGLKGSCQDPRDSNFPWIAEPGQKLKGARSEWLDGAGCTGGYGTSDVYVQRQMAPSAPVTVDLTAAEIASFFS